MCLGYKRAALVSMVGVAIALSDLLIISFIAIYISSIVSTKTDYLNLVNETIGYYTSEEITEIAMSLTLVILAISRIWLTKYLVKSAFRQCNSFFEADIKYAFDQPLISFARKELSDYIDKYSNRYNIIFFNIMISMYLFLSNITLLAIYLVSCLIINPTITVFFATIITAIGIITLQITSRATDADAKIIDHTFKTFTLKLTNALRSIIYLKVSNTVLPIVNTIIND